MEKKDDFIEEKEITFIQPRHNYAWKEWEWHIYLSSPLLSVKSRLLKALWGNTNITYIDANFEEPDYNKLKWIVWINLVWAPYVPVVLDLIEQIPKEVHIILWGQIISSFTDEEFKRLFNKDRDNVINWNNTDNLEQIFGLEKNSIPDVEEINLIDSYEEISDEHMKKYLDREFSLYLSQWCKYNCWFCQAAKKKPEKYRNLPLLKEELIYLWKRAEKLGINKLEFYVSNLDILQTPKVFEQFLDIILEIKEEIWIDISFRWLCWVESFLDVYYNNKDILIKAKKSGLSSIWFWIDWATPEIWKSIWKWQNFKNLSKYENFEAQEKSIEVIKLTSELWITPEALMVFWHPWETNESLELAHNFCEDMFEQYGAIPRPHISKTILPWAEAWTKKENKSIVDKFIENPEFFQALDYTALHSELTHPDIKLRKLSRKWYKKICDLSPEYATKYIIPNTPEYRKIAKRLRTTVKKMNEWKFDR